MARPLSQIFGEPSLTRLLLRDYPNRHGVFVGCGVAVDGGVREGLN